MAMRKMTFSVPETLAAGLAEHEVALIRACEIANRDPM
jgi:hypothetical protein